jgi:hypothetical protein
MRQLTNDRDLAEMLSEDNAALFVFVDWSEYARRGKGFFEDVAAKLAVNSRSSSISCWMVDLSSTDAPPNPALHKWVLSEQAKGHVRLLPSIAMGNGSVLWIKRGEVVGFEPSAQRLGPTVLLQHGQQILTGA